MRTTTLGRIAGTMLALLVAAGSARPAGPAVVRAEGGPVGPELVVGGDASSRAGQPAVATDAAGRFVVAWPSTHRGTLAEVDVYVRRYGADGNPLGSARRVNAFSENGGLAVGLAMDPAGSFVVAWAGGDEDAAGAGIYVRRFGPDGEPRGEEFRINTSTDSRVDSPAVAMDAGGSFVVIWRSSPDASALPRRLYARRFGADGGARGDPFEVTNSTPDALASPAVAMDAEGGFVVAWSTFSDVHDRTTIRARRFGPGGLAQGREFGITSDALVRFDSLAVANDAEGNFVVVWSTSTGVEARRFGSRGVARGHKFRVDAGFIRGDVAVAMAGGGDFVVTWARHDLDVSPSRLEVHAQRYGPDGGPRGEPLRVSTTILEAPLRTAAAMDPDGDFVVAWNGGTALGAPPIVRGRVYRYDDPPADLSLRQVAAPDPATVGQPLTYTLSVANAGPGVATGLTLVDTLPANVTVRSVTGGRGRCTQTGRRLTCSLVALGVGKRWVVPIVVVPLTAGTLVNHAAVRALQADPTPTGNQVSRRTEVRAR